MYSAAAGRVGSRAHRCPVIRAAGGQPGGQVAAVRHAGGPAVEPARGQDASPFPRCYPSPQLALARPRTCARLRDEGRHRSCSDPRSVDWGRAAGERRPGPNRTGHEARRVHTRRLRAGPDRRLTARHWHRGGRAWGSGLPRGPPGSQGTWRERWVAGHRVSLRSPGAGGRRG